MDRNRGFPLIIDGFPLYPFLLFRSIRTNQAGYLSIDLKIARSYRFSFISATNIIIAATIRKKQAKELEALASPRPTMIIHGKQKDSIRTS